MLTPILGMEKYSPSVLKGVRNVSVYTSPGDASQSMTHGDFDNDDRTRNKVLSLL
jgi:hypothetical protein